MKELQHQKLGESYFELGTLLEETFHLEKSAYNLNKAFHYFKLSQDFKNQLITLEKLAVLYDKLGEHYKATLCYGDCQNLSASLQKAS